MTKRSCCPKCLFKRTLSSASSSAAFFAAASATTFFAFSIDISGLLEQGQEGPGQEEGSQAVDLEALAHRLCRELREGNALGKDAGVVDEQVEAVLRAYDVAHLPEETRI